VFSLYHDLKGRKQEAVDLQTVETTPLIEAIPRDSDPMCGMSPRAFYGTTLAWFLLSLTLALVVQKISLVIDYIGGLAASFIFIFPGECVRLRSISSPSHMQMLRPVSACVSQEFLRDRRHVAAEATDDALHRVGVCHPGLCDTCHEHWAHHLFRHQSKLFLKLDFWRDLTVETFIVAHHHFLASAWHVELKERCEAFAVHSGHLYMAGMLRWALYGNHTQLCQHDHNNNVSCKQLSLKC
jgi:hypothetical protein